MSKDETLKWEKNETVSELLDLLRISQEMGQRLATETHGESYNLVREVNELLHLVHEKVDLIEKNNSHEN